MQGNTGFLRLLGCIALVSVTAATAFGQSVRALVVEVGMTKPAERGAIAGRIVSGVGGEPIAGATVTLDIPGDPRSWQSDSMGYFLADNIDAGHYSLTASAPLYRANSLEVIVVQGNVSQVSIRLEPLPTEVSGCQITIDAAKTSFQHAFGELLSLLVAGLALLLGSAVWRQ